MKKASIIIGSLLLLGIVYMTIRLTVLTKDNTIYDVNGLPIAPAQDGTTPNAQVDQDDKVVTPTDDEIIERIFPEKTYKKVNEVEYVLRSDLDEGIVGNTFIPDFIVRGDIDNDLYTDAFVIAEVTSAASVSNTAYLVTRKGIKENFDGTTLEGRILFLEGGFTNNKQLYIVYIQVVTGEKERVLYDYSVINGEMTLKKVSSRMLPADNPQPREVVPAEEDIVEEVI